MRLHSPWPSASRDCRCFGVGADARANHLTQLPDMLGLKNLRDLNVSDNDLEVINYSIKNLSQLTVRLSAVENNVAACAQ